MEICDHEKHEVLFEEQTSQFESITVFRCNACGIIDGYKITTKDLNDERDELNFCKDTASLFTKLWINETNLETSNLVIHRDDVSLIMGELCRIIEPVTQYTPNESKMHIRIMGEMHSHALEVFRLLLSQCDEEMLKGGYQLWYDRFISNMYDWGEE